MEQPEGSTPATPPRPSLAKNGILDAIGGTPLVYLPNLSKPRVHIYAKLEGHNPTGSVKDRIAKYMIERAEAEGALTHDKIVLEPTSGNTGISLAMVCKVKGYRLKVVMPENVSPERAQLLEAFGAEVTFSDGEGGSNHAIVVAKQLYEADPDTYFMPYQYGNASNPWPTTRPPARRSSRRCRRWTPSWPGWAPAAR